MKTNLYNVKYKIKTEIIQMIEFYFCIFSKLSYCTDLSFKIIRFVCFGLYSEQQQFTSLHIWLFLKVYMGFFKRLFSLIRIPIIIWWIGIEFSCDFSIWLPSHFPKCEIGIHSRCAMDCFLSSLQSHIVPFLILYLCIWFH